MFVRRGMRLPGGDVIPFRDPPSPDRLCELGARLHLDDQARLLAGGVAYLSGEVPRVTPYEVGLPGHVAQTRAGAEWRDDPLILDERWLAVHLRGKGIVVFSACSHAGIVNVLRHARAAFEDAPLYAVMGGLHLSGALNEKIIPETVRDMAAFRLERILPGHCTGWRAINALSQAFGETVTPIAVGQTHDFEGMRQELQ
jgi:7,8-dihydropterin-6-yl-methyl-4-(beta-D-ribofuranosyl)aminobenzene 5'-phosphate synthase